MSDSELRVEVNKRLTLNWLIQGAAQHAGMTAHHLVRGELDVIDPRLLRLYDQYALINLLQYWYMDGVMIFGHPNRFWRSATKNSGHPFYNHPLLSRHGGMLALSAKKRGLERAKEKNILFFPLIFAFQASYVKSRLRAIETSHRQRLLEIAKKSTNTIWGIPMARLDGAITSGRPTIGELMPARTNGGALWRSCIVGYGGVVRRGEGLAVIARATNWQLLNKELVKGTAELICLHGLNTLDDDDCRQVLDAADWLEYEPWMLQTGGELWRHLLAVLPEGEPIAQSLMQLARLPANSLQSVMNAVIEDPGQARERLRQRNG